MNSRNVLYFQFAPTLDSYTGNGDTFKQDPPGDPGGNQTGINSLLVFESVPAEIGWKVGKIPMRMFGDFATNFEADERATAAGHSDKGGDQVRVLNLLGIGQLKEKGRLGGSCLVATHRPGTQSTRICGAQTSLIVELTWKALA